jgi:hypothetical protein
VNAVAFAVQESLITKTISFLGFCLTCFEFLVTFALPRDLEEIVISSRIFDKKNNFLFRILFKLFIT